MSRVTDKEGIEAYNTLMNYCKTRSSCKDCVLVMEDEESCIMEYQDIPKDWQRLEIN